MLNLLVIDGVLLFLVTITALAVIEMRNLFAVTMLTGVYSLLMAAVWTNMHAVDVAFTEAAVGAGISTILILGTLVHVGVKERRREKSLNLSALLIVTLTGGALIYGTLDMPAFGDPEAPVQTHRFQKLFDQNVGKVPVTDTHHVEAVAHGAEQHGGEQHGAHEDEFHGHVYNTVTSLLADYRSFDTMFETAVILSAGLSMIMLLRRRSDEEIEAATQRTERVDPDTIKTERMDPKTTQTVRVDSPPGSDSSGADKKLAAEIAEAVDSAEQIQHDAPEETDKGDQV